MFWIEPAGLVFVPVSPQTRLRDSRRSQGFGREWRTEKTTPQARGGVATSFLRSRQQEQATTTCPTEESRAPRASPAPRNDSLGKKQALNESTRRARAYPRAQSGTTYLSMSPTGNCPVWNPTTCMTPSSRARLNVRPFFWNPATFNSCETDPQITSCREPHTVQAERSLSSRWPPIAAWPMFDPPWAACIATGLRYV